MSLNSLRLFRSRFQWIPVPEKFAISSCLALLALLSIQAASIGGSSSQAQVPEATPLSQEDSDPGLEVTAPPEVADDPLNSPYPIPWPWIVEMQNQAASLRQSQTRYYRTQALISPDRKYAAYSRIQMELTSDPLESQVNSMLFLEDLETGDLQFVTASSPNVRNPNIPPSDYEQPGMIAVMVPVGWSESSDRLLVRGFDSMFGTDLASDYAIVWSRDNDTMRAIAPNNLQYTNAVLLGWSQANPNSVLFRAGDLGDEQWPLVAVNMNSFAITATDDQPVAYGQLTENFWSGPQLYISSQ